MTKRRRTFIVAVVAAMIMNVALCFGMFAAANDEVTIADNDYNLAESVDVRLSYNDKGELNAARNGLRVKATVSERHYNALGASESAVVKYGILVAPASYAAENALTYENVFGENRVYATSATQVEDDKENDKTTLKIDCSEQELLAKGNDGYYYAFCTLSDLDNEGLMGKYVAKAYVVSYTVNEYGMVENPVYSFKDGEKAINAVYAVQKAIEENRAGDYSEALKSAYIDGKTQDVTVKVTTFYDGASLVEIKKTLTFNVGETVTTEGLIERMTDFDASAYELKSGIDATKIYAGVSPELELSFSTKKTDSKKPAIGVYASRDTLVQITESGLTKDDGAVMGYSLFSDGTIVIDGENGKTIFGKFDSAKKQLTVGNVIHDQVLELDRNTYSEFISFLSGLYTYDGKTVRINADGTADFDLLGNAQKVKYIFTYDEINGRFIAAFGNGVVKELSIAEEEGGIADFTRATLAEEVDYENIANYYTCVTAGDNLNKIYRFNIDGSIVCNGVNVGSFAIFQDETKAIKAGINGVAYTVAVNQVDYNFGLTIKTLTLTNSSGEVAMTLRNEYTSDFDKIYKAANNLFGYDSRVFDGSTTMGGNYNPGRPRLTLTAESTKIDALREEATCDGKPLWKHADYGTTNWGSDVLSKNGHYLSYWIEPITPATGVIHFKVHNISDQSIVNEKTKDVKYEIDALRQMHIDMQYDPHGLGEIGQYQDLVTDISEKTYGSYKDEKNVYNLFASESGTYYLPTQYRAEDATLSIGSLRLFNFHTEIESLKNDYYACEYWAEKDAYVQSGYERTTIAYKIDFDYSKNVGKLTVMWGDGSHSFVYNIGIVNGNRFIDMRDPSITGVGGYAPFNNLKMTVVDQADNDYATIGYAISTLNKTFVNAAKPADAPAADTRTIYEKIAGNYKTKKYYGETESWWHDIGIVLNADGSLSMSGGVKCTGTYTINEITDTFGEISINGSYNLTNGNVGYYALIDGYYVIRLTNVAMNAQKWSFWDFLPDGCSFSTWDVFDAVTGEGTTYTDGSATITLDKLGAKSQFYTGATFTLTDGDVTVTGSYDFVPTAVGAGKLFINIPSEAEDSKRYIIGEYKLVGDSYVLSFSIDTAGITKTYLMSVGSLDGVYAQVTGSYFGVENIEFTSEAEISFTSITSGTISENGITAKFVIDGDRVTLAYERDGLDIVVIK